LTNVHQGLSYVEISFSMSLTSIRMLPQTGVSIDDDVVSEEETVVQPPDNQGSLQEGQHWYPRRNRCPLVRYGIDDYVDMACIGKAEDPESIEEALQSRLSKKWQEVVDLEFQSLTDLVAGRDTQRQEASWVEVGIQNQIW